MPPKRARERPPPASHAYGQKLPPKRRRMVESESEEEAAPATSDRVRPDAEMSSSLGDRAPDTPSDFSVLAVDQPPGPASASGHSGIVDKENAEPVPRFRPNMEENIRLQEDQCRRQVAKARQSILDRITEKATPRMLVGLDKELTELYNLLAGTVKHGESNSCLLFGARGTGKTMLIKRALEKLSREMTADWCQPNSTPTTKRFFKVQLSGLAQTDDKVALREIARQLALEIDEDSDEISKKTFAEALAQLLSVFRSSGREAVPVLFVLDEFELFAEQPRQSLLYTLFDICQGGKSPVAVVGVTCRLNAVELLEKRVKSRFSHRQIRLSPPASFEDYQSIAANALVLSPDTEDEKPYFENFNNHTSKALEHHNFQTVARRLYDRDKSVRALFKIFIDPVSALTPDKPFLEVESICDSDARQRADAKMELLRGVSILELQLIIAMKRHHEREVMFFNFEMIYDEYKDFIDRGKTSGSVGLQRSPKQVAMKAFERLQSFELVCPVESASRCPKEYRMVRLLLEPAQVVDAVKRHPNCPILMQRWATNSLAAG